MISILKKCLFTNFFFVVNQVVWSKMVKLMFWILHAEFRKVDNTDLVLSNITAFWPGD